MTSRQTPAADKGGPTRPSPNTPYHPNADTSTYRDLLLFEERLKMNAEMLRRRRRRYSAFLWSFVAALAWLAHGLIFAPPKSLLKMRALQASIAVVVITLVLFFASGMYEEKIRYAHSYINHSNRSLRPLNMHLNMRRPRTALFPFLPLSFRSSPKPPTAPPLPAPLRNIVPPGPSPTINGRRASTTSTVMGQIPPSSNPRGELIFSSRVDRSFREGYERYRTAFERRREEKAREEARKRARGWFGSKKGLGVGPGGNENVNSTFRGGTPTPPISRRETPPPRLSGAVPSRGRTPSPGLNGVSRLKASQLGSTAGNNSTAAGEGDHRERDARRERAESYSFVWNGRDEGSLRRAP